MRSGVLSAISQLHDDDRATRVLADGLHDLAEFPHTSLLKRSGCYSTQSLRASMWVDIRWMLQKISRLYLKSSPDTDYRLKSRAEETEL